MDKKLKASKAGDRPRVLIPVLLSLKKNGYEVLRISRVPPEPSTQEPGIFRVPVVLGQRPKEKESQAT
jgi:hypothetical protein